MDTSIVSLWLSKNAIWIAIIVIVGYMGYYIYDLYVNNKKKINKLKKKFIKKEV